MKTYLPVPRRSALALMSAGAFLCTKASTVGAAVMLSDSQSTILGNAAQIAAERCVLRLLQDPDVLAFQDKLKAELATWPRGQTVDGAERIDVDVLQWTTGLILDVVSYLQREKPWFSIGNSTSPRRWFGHTFPGNGKAGDNPDSFGRGAIIDGSGRYEVAGQIDTSKPLIQFVQGGDKTSHRNAGVLLSVAE